MEIGGCYWGGFPKTGLGGVSLLPPSHAVGTDLYAGLLFAALQPLKSKESQDGECPTRGIARNLGLFLSVAVNLRREGELLGSILALRRGRRDLHPSPCRIPHQQPGTKFLVEIRGN